MSTRDADGEPQGRDALERDGRLRVGLLKCGSIRRDLVGDFGDYPELFAELMSDHDIELVTFDVEHDEFPDSPTECDGWLVSGSASSVYEPLPWIGRTRDLLAEIVTAGVPLVAVCFGHQLLAQALGGEVQKSERGWGVGVHHYDVIAPLTGWPDDAPQPTQISLIASHQDQVVRVPASVTILAASHHCPVAAFSFGRRVLAIQAHPEFGPALARGLIQGRRDVIGSERAEAALATLDQPIDQSAIAHWFAAILAT